jgi:hypothetical protein
LNQSIINRSNKILFSLIISVICFNQIVFSQSDSNNEKYFHIIKEFKLGVNDEFETPYYVLLGKNPAIKMLVHGGMHGDEIASYMACEEILKNINLLEGTLIIIPKLNIKACNMNTREINIDLNHTFPGDQKSDIYEYRLAHEFMWLVDSLKPDLIINLHEARKKYNPKYESDSESAYGQIAITCINPIEDFLITAITNLNAKIPSGDFQFHPHFYSFRNYSSLDNFVSKFLIKSYTIETFRGFNIGDRVKLQVLAVLQFMDEIGLKYEYPEVKFN